MLSVITNAWKVADIRKKLLYTLMMLLVVRLGAHIPIPGIDHAALEQLLNQNQGGMTLYSIISGGAFSHMSIFGMGVGPYITASIIMQLLTIGIPTVEQWAKEGEDGRKKINKITRYMTVVLATIQGIALTYSYHNIFVDKNFFSYVISIVSLVAGTTFIMWMGEQITAKGLGNGTSLIIFINIISNFPNAVRALYMYASGGDIAGVIKIVVLLAAFVFVIAFAILASVGERRLPVQYSKKMVGRKMYGGQSSFIPIKVNIAGVISIIFAISLLQFPQTIGQFVQNKATWFQGLIDVLAIKHPVGAILYVALIIFFTFFYSGIVFNPVEVAENMKKNGGFIPGIRPGKPTSDYITKVVAKVTLIGALFYSIIALVPVLIEWIFKIQNVGFGGTTVLIVVGVALDTVKQIESQLLMRHYKGFLNN